MAEELAEIDLISRGRLVTGWVRGAGSEQFFNNANPAYNREMFNEAHDFIVQAWTKPGPWRYEGKHFHYRHVNPWALPYQEATSAHVDSRCAEPRRRPAGARNIVTPTWGWARPWDRPVTCGISTRMKPPSTAIRPARKTLAI